MLRRVRGRRRTPAGRRRADGRPAGTPSERRFPSRSTGLEKHRVPAPGTEKHRAERHRARKTQGPRNTGPAGADRARDTGPGGSDRLETPASNPPKTHAPAIRRRERHMLVRKTHARAKDTCSCERHMLRSAKDTCSARDTCSDRRKTHASIGQRHMLRRFRRGRRHLLRSARDTCSGDSGRPETPAPERHRLEKTQGPRDTGGERHRVRRRRSGETPRPNIGTPGRPRGPGRPTDRGRFGQSSSGVSGKAVAPAGA